MLQKVAPALKPYLTLFEHTSAYEEHNNGKIPEQLHFNLLCDVIAYFILSRIDK